MGDSDILSKTFNMSGWRVGMVSGNKANITNILTVKSNNAKKLANEKFIYSYYFIILF